MRIILLILTAVFGIYGFIGGSVLVVILIATNATVNGRRGYLYPLIPFNFKAMRSLFVRVRKYDF
jgi:stage V sporulation protein AF